MSRLSHCITRVSRYRWVSNVRTHLLFLQLSTEVMLVSGEMSTVDTVSVLLTDSEAA